MQLITGEVKLKDGIVIDNINAHIVLYYKYNQYEPFLIDINEDACEFLQGGKKSKVLIIFYTTLIRYSNLYNSCPWGVRNTLSLFNRFLKTKYF